ncbi:acetylornithine transaminase [Enterococcus sp. BWB1-3]|uniref:acetylornithine transaminase n=1 Tax=Enterococcus sp. BWB1-3 TaxID=2787713 RepID=UPI001922950C|nr:acetylornithine transaminase [Enterococcus sp. BWB1-3]MBL1230120.1 acetylornithine transaminase [Enterococcus sp. BWB1-3]
MSYLFPNYLRKSIEFVEGDKCSLMDAQGKRYLDLTSGIGVVNLGYNHPVLNQTLQEQSQKVWHIPNLYKNSLQERVAEKLADGKEYVAYFCNSGAEANEAAIKLARKATGRTKIISFLQSFHGRTFGAMSATGQDSIHADYHPLVPGFIYVPYNSLEGLKEHLDNDTAAVIVEVIQGEGGVIPAKQEWLKELKAVCQDNGSLLIVDEIQTGIGRTGTFYASDGYDLVPDIITLAKGLGNGFPVGAMLGKKELAASFGPGSHGSTFGGNLLAMSIAENVIDLINQEEFLSDVAVKGKKTIDELSTRLKENRVVNEVRGTGLMIGIELINSQILAQAIDKLQLAGVLVLKAGSNVLRLLPPLTITEKDLAKGVDKICRVLEEIAND